jgi:AraC family transcriptional regulator
MPTDDYEFVWMLHGQATFVTADEPVPLTPGVLLLIPPGFRHGLAWDADRPSRHGYVHSDPSMWRARSRPRGWRG